MDAKMLRLVSGAVVLALSVSLYLFLSVGPTGTVTLTIGMFVGFALVFSGWFQK